MKKIYLLALTALMAGSAVAQEVKVGIERPLVPNSTNYDTFAYITTADFNKSADGVTVSFWQSPEIEATIVKDATQEGGYEIKQVCHQGVKNIDCDYVWKLNCAEYDSSLKRHKNETLGSENWAFGFDLTVADGKSFTLSAINFDLLVEQNPMYRIRILKGTEEIYNSTWVTKTGGYNNQQWGAGSYCRITKDDVSFLFTEKDAEGNAINYQAIQYYPGFEDGVGTLTPLGNITLTAGTYRVVADVDFAKDSSKAMSFDNFTLEGTISGGQPGPVSGPFFSWEAGVATGGTVEAMGGNSALTESAITVSAKKANIADDNVTITFDQPREAGDVISITGYRKKDTDANGTLYFLFENGYTIDEGDNVVWNNIHENVGQQPNTNTYVVGEGAGSKTLKLARSKASTNVFITKITITRGGTNDIDIPVVAPVKKANGAIYDFAGKRVKNTVPGKFYIRDGKAFIAK